MDRGPVGRVVIGWEYSEQRRIEAYGDPDQTTDVAASILKVCFGDNDRFRNRAKVAGRVHLPDMKGELVFEQTLMPPRLHHFYAASGGRPVHVAEHLDAAGGVGDGIPRKPEEFDPQRPPADAEGRFKIDRRVDTHGEAHMTRVRVGSARGNPVEFGDEESSHTDPPFILQAQGAAQLIPTQEGVDCLGVRGDSPALRVSTAHERVRLCRAGKGKNE